MHNCECGKFEEITRDVPLGPMIHQIDRLMFRNLSSRVRAEGLDEVTLMHGWVMRYLYENRDRVICQKDIEHTFDIRRSTVTNIIQLMEKKGYVERRSVLGDARLKCVSLTAKGEENHLQMEHLISMLEKEQVIDITEEELPYLGVLKAVLGYMDTEHYNYADLANEIDLKTGGISSQINIYADTKKKDSFHAKYEVRSKILYQNLEEGLRLLSEILMGTQITDEKRLYEILARIKSRLQMSLSSAGHSVSAMRAMSYFSPVARFNDLVGGIALYRTIAELEEHFEEKKQFLMDKLRSLTEKIFVKNRLLISLTADAEGYQLLEEKFPQFLTVLPDGEKEGEAVTFHCEKKNEGFLDASKVQYVSRAGNYLSKGYSYTGALRILKVILSYDYLWINVRVKGGAYGCMSGFMRNGDAYFTSYRDPNLKSTNEIYEGIPAYLRAFDADERDMTKYIIGTVSDMDTPLNPAAKGMRSVSAYLTNISYEELQRERNEVLDAQPENIKNLAGLIEAVLAQDALCVIGAEENVEAEKDMFLEVKNLY